MLKNAGILLIWGLTLWAVLQLNDFKFAQAHSICGIWGCGPPVKTLVMCHLAWCVILFPLAWIIPPNYSRLVNIITGRTLIAAGLLTVLIIGTYEACTWLQRVGDAYQKYYFHRWAFVVITLTDVPIVQTVILGGLFCWSGNIHSLSAEEDVEETSGRQMEATE